MAKLLIKIKNYIFYSVIMLLVAACAQEAAPPEDTAVANVIIEIPAAELYQRIETDTAPLIIDVRSSDEFAAGHLPGALNVAHSEFIDTPTESVALLPTAKDAEIVVHCVSGKRAKIAMDVISSAGYTNVSHLIGDFNGWQAAGYPIEQDNLPN
ncbi:MAG: rhodanese-like domain-containing protein [Gammaproteobacteria bacterium]|nr:MAG: rhodanese-like domain-containing protein [Gammaproteobacteria bacterium]